MEGLGARKMSVVFIQKNRSEAPEGLMMGGGAVKHGPLLPPEAGMGSGGP
jgi:hypothetical protein